MQATTETGTSRSSMRGWLALIVPALALSLLFAPAAAALNLAVEVTPDEPAPGNFLNVRIMVANPDGAVASNVRLELLYPAGLTSTSNSLVSDGGSCPLSSCDNGEVATWNLGNLAPGTGRTVYLPPRVSTSTPNEAVIDFQVSAFVGEALAASASQSVEVIAEPVLTLVVDPDTDPVEPGGVVTWHLNFAHRGGTTASTDTELRVTLPDDTILVAADQGGQSAGDQVTWALGILNPGQASRRSLSVQLGPSYTPGDLLELEEAWIEGEREFETVSATARSAVRVESGPALGLGVTVGMDPARPGARATTQLTVTNRIDSLISGVAIELIYPQGLSS